MADEQLNQTKIAKDRVMKNKKDIAHAPIKEDKKEKEENKAEVKESSEKSEEKKEVKKVEKKVKKTSASVYAKNLQISTRHAVAIGNFIKNRKINESIKNLETVLNMKMAIPFKGEFAHRKGLMLNGKKMMSGKYPQNSSKEFIRLLKSLAANCSANGMDVEKTIVYEVISNKAPKQHHRFGSTVFKRTHVLIKAKELGNEKKVGGKK